MLRTLALALALALAIPQGAQALDTNDLLSLVAMPLAVAAVSNLTGVPQQDLVSVLTALNQANVPAPQFVEIVRYVPVVLVQPSGTQFVTFVTTQASQGISGDALAAAIAERLRSAGVTEINVTTPPPPPVVVVDQNLIPPMVVTRVEAQRQRPHSDSRRVSAEQGQHEQQGQHGEQRDRGQNVQQQGENRDVRGGGHLRTQPPVMQGNPPGVAQQAPPGKAQEKEKSDKGKGKGKDKGKDR